MFCISMAGGWVAIASLAGARPVIGFNAALDGQMAESGSEAPGQEGPRTTHWRKIQREDASPESAAPSLPQGALQVGADWRDERAVWLVANPEVTGVTFGRALDLAGPPVDFAAVERRRAFRPNSPTSGGLTPVGLPVLGGRISSRFGMRLHPLLGGYRMHAGIDLPAPFGSRVVATTDGVVNYASRVGAYGLVVSIQSTNGVETRFGHLSGFAVSSGARVRSGQVIGYVGSTGRSTGPHVHYEVRRGGRAVDPLNR